MGDTIKAGVVFVSKFCTPGTTFDSYVNYIDREDAVRNENMYKYSLYNDYMGNPEKTTSLFTESKDMLTQDEKKSLKDVFKQAEENGSIMWQHVISYDNRWLEQQGLMNRETGIINEEKLKQLTRLSMMKLQKNEQLENAVWSAAIHFNTDNIHVHIAMVEPVPMRVMKENERRGKLKQSSLNKAKSAIVNDILEHQPENEMINNIIRNNIIQTKKRNVMVEDQEFTKLFMEVHSELPKDRRQWNYNNNSIKHLIPKIDKMTDIYIDKYHKKDMEELNDLLAKQDEKYRTAYGNSVKGSYAENKKKDMYYRMGNVILKQIKEFDKQERARIYEEAKQNGKKISPDSLNIYNGNKLRHSTSQHGLKAAVEFTKIFMKNEYDKIKNQIAYEEMKRTIEIENDTEINSEKEK